MKKEMPSVGGLEEKLLQKLRSTWPDVKDLTGHVSVVREGHWWAVYVYAPPNMEGPTFEQVVRKVRALLRRLWPVKYCLPLNSAAMGREISRKRFCVHWLPVPPNRLPEDFKRFYPQ